MCSALLLIQNAEIVGVPTLRLMCTYSVCAEHGALICLLSRVCTVLSFIVLRPN